MSQPIDPSKHFLELHRKGEPLLADNVWDAGSARLLESLGYQVLATTSSGHAGTLGRLDGGVARAGFPIPSFVERLTVRAPVPDSVRAPEPH